MLRGEQPKAVEIDPDQGEVDGPMTKENGEQPGGEESGRKAGEGAAHAGGEEDLAAPGRAARQEDGVGETRERQDDEPDDEEFGGRERVIAVMLGIIGSGESAEAQESADEGGWGGDGAINGGALHEGTDDAELAAGGIGVGHCLLCTTKLHAWQWFCG